MSLTLSSGEAVEGEVYALEEKVSKSSRERKERVRERKRKQVTSSHREKE